MIYIEERIPQKVTGLSSLFIAFTYRPELVSILKNVPSATFNSKLKYWEAPVKYLSTILDGFCLYDTIHFTALKSKKAKQDVVYDLCEYKTKPFDYQIDAIQYGLNHDCWLLLDAPGLGKSLCLTYLAQELKVKRGVEHCLVICGINTLKGNWKKEIKKHSDLSCMVLGERINSKGNSVIESVAYRTKQLNNEIKEFFVITNIETLRDKGILKALLTGPNKFDMVIFDECHVAKNPEAQATKNLLKLITPKYRIGATGTLLLNSPLDAYVPLKWIGKDHAIYSNFRYYYMQYSGDFNNNFVGYRNTDTLKHQLEQCSLRRTKDLLNLPPKTIIHEYVDMSDNQSNFYNNIVSGMVGQVDKVHIDATSVLGMVTRLRQATVCPSILTSENIDSAKINRAVELAEQILSTGNKVVIFSMFKEPASIIHKKLSAYNPLLCTGDVKDDVVSKNIDEFQENPNCSVLVATFAKMSTGITLTAASYMICLDSCWTAANNTQAEDRIYRIGSDAHVFIYYLITSNTIDEKVYDIVTGKGLVSDYIVDDVVPPNYYEELKKYILDLAS